MEHFWKSYNAFPTLLEANNRFTNRKQVFFDLTKLLSRYGNAFGVCLVHTHCGLLEGEIMLEKDDISQPVSVSEAGRYYAERWLPSGVPYEFTSRPTETPPEALFNEFKAMTQDAGVLGLYHVGREAVTRVEWTEGRKNMVRDIKDEDWHLSPVETAWNLGRGDPVTMVCVLLCATATTESGGYYLSK
ncbi:uncharacterized protein K460DRAFT_379386 [Cucurbitaria berberidis CBS 394.84]|uniref:Uncharacterized protein n=1 Tax=Cucurbitaria berberidis CBS 394.84 TaxID=1168544 RepID=A0A9P4GED0_9PLEO|nr:uncharacterized protein K460DRAFT_379386 [Cucurbitaria berberidis CBS 394.84]KAF1844443.1 hypothetical protein K460DRAFT_379386 [Cucurbitaria berberidis CBS 394.84]